MIAKVKKMLLPLSTKTGTDIQRQQKQHTKPESPALATFIGTAEGRTQQSWKLGNVTGQVRNHRKAYSSLGCSHTS